MRKALFATVLVLCAVTAAGGAATAATTIVYDNIPTPQPGNVPSIGYEATSTSEFGGQVGLAATARTNPRITVLMSSWGCENGHWYSGDCSTSPGAVFSHPITMNLYEVGSGGAVGALIASKTETFEIPYRPSADDVNCTGGLWYDGTACFNGYATPISFTFNGLTLPNNVIVSVAYNTSHYGSDPYGTDTACYTSSGGCGYDSLNVGTAPGPSIGNAPLPDDAYLDSTWAGAYCDNGSGGTGSFRLDAGCWTGFQPAFRVEATYVNVPADGVACKKGGWQSLTRADGSTFKNQGDCIQYVNTGK